MTREEKELLEEVFRFYRANLESEQYRAEMETGKSFPIYDKKIEQAKALQKKILGA